MGRDDDDHAEMDPDALMRRGDKKMTVSFTRWKPDLDEAVRCYEEAGVKYKATRRKKQAIVAFEKCAEASERQGSEWHAGKHLEQCAMLAKDAGTPAEVAAFAERACAAYCTAGRAQRGAECLGKCAKLIEDADGDVACGMLLRACEMLTDDDKHVYAQDLFRTAGSIKMRQEKFQEASDVMLRFGACCDVTDSAPNLCKAYLSAIIALLYAGDGVGAQATYADVSGVPNFQGSEEQRTCYGLIDAFRDADVTQIQRVVERSSTAAFLEPPFARAAKKLPRPGVDLKALSVKMGGGGGVLAQGEGFMGDRVPENVDDIDIGEEDDDDLT